MRTPRWLGYLIQRPESHCRHHEFGVHASNYSDLPLWDILFGSFHNPASWEGRAGFSDDIRMKAIGTSNLRIVGMILLQAIVVGSVGYAIGMGLTAVFFAITSHRDATRGIVLLWQVMAGSGVVVLFIVLVSSLLSIRKVLVLEPAIVFRG